MNKQGADEPAADGKSKDNLVQGSQHLFGLRSGAEPWDEKASEGAGKLRETPTPDTSSAPYPKDATYTPRQPEEQGTESQKENGIFSDVDDEGELTRLHPNYKLLMHFTALIVALVLLVVGIIADFAISENLNTPFGIVIGISVLLALFILFRIPIARYNARGYQISRDRLWVVRGIMWRSDAIVPFGRVQHIDVDQGPVERALNIATLTLHTAGSHNASVKLPGLGHELAVTMREEIRAHIKRESV